MRVLFGRAVPRWKRVLDLLVAVPLVVLLTPLFVLVAAYIKCVSRGPVFFRQERIGYRGDTFVMWKFRSMQVGADVGRHEEHVRGLIEGESVCRMRKLDDDPQIIPFGRIIRKLCIDELPQLFNVIFGEMSLVGPRPAIPYEVAKYQPWHYARFDCLPGMTGLWQVSGKNRLTFRQMVALDIRYGRRLSFWEDLRIMACTPWAILGQCRTAVSRSEPEALETLRAGSED